jgi:hypothetical protein
VLDDAELTFPFERPTRFKDLESGEELAASPQAVREQYMAALQSLIETYRRELRLAGIDYQLLNTSQPLDAALLSYLALRNKRH